MYSNSTISRSQETYACTNSKIGKHMYEQDNHKGIERTTTKVKRKLIQQQIGLRKSYGIGVYKIQIEEGPFSPR